MRNPVCPRSRINLLPWRELERRRRARAMAGALAGTLLVAVLLVLTAGRFLEERIRAQEQRNRMLEKENAALEARIEEARHRRTRLERLEERIAVIHRLRDSRAATVRVFDALAGTMVEGIHYRRVERRGAMLTVRGFAASNRLVAELMRNLENSAQFTSAHLKRLREDPHGAAYGPEASTFEMTFLQAEPGAAGQEGVTGAAGKEG